MDLSDRDNWRLSGAVGVLLAANGLVRLPGPTDALGLLLAGLLVTGGGLAAWNAVVALRDPEAGGGVEWTRGKTVVNLVAVVVLSLALVVSVANLLA